jgi:hypothetical protein
VDRIRTPFFVLALVAILVNVLIERSSLRAAEVARRLPPVITGSRQTSLDQVLDVFTPEQKRRLDVLRQEKTGELSNLPRDLEGFGARSLMFVDGILLFTLALMGISLLAKQIEIEHIHARLQGIVTLIFCILLILYALPWLLVVLAKLMMMVAMLLSFPFGTLAYLIIFGSFPRAEMNAVISLLFTLRMIFAVLLVLAHQGFLKNIWLIIYVVAAFVASLIVSFLYNLVPGILVSITDAIAAIVVAVIGIVLALLLAISAILAIVAALKPK